MQLLFSNAKFMVFPHQLDITRRHRQGNSQRVLQGRAAQSRVGVVLRRADLSTTRIRCEKWLRNADSL